MSKIIFQTKFKELSTTPRNHGRIWTFEDEVALTNIFKTGANLPTIAQSLGRKNSSILKRLVKMKLLHRDYSINHYDYIYYYAVLPDGEANSSVVMSNLLINNIDVAFLSDERIIEELVKLDAQIRRLEEVRRPPKIMLNRIRTLKEEYDRIAFYCDNRPKKDQTT